MNFRSFFTLLFEDLSSMNPYTRHAELEAKYHEGTITPEEMKEAQKLVDEAAKNAGYNIGPVHHGTQSAKRFNEFIGMWNYRFAAEKGTTYFTDNKTVASGYGVRVMDAYLRMTNPLEVDAKGKHWTIASPSALVKSRKEGHDGVIIRNVMDAPAGVTNQTADVFVTFTPSQIKSADPFTGTPLAQRFDPQSNDIKESQTPI